MRSLMSTTTIYTEKLFSYGTLRYESVQLATFGRKLNGKNDTLIGYILSELKITSPDVVKISGDATHPILNYTGKESDQVEGVVFDVSTEELQHADEYEVDDYKRVSVQLASGINAWVYINANE